MSQWVNVGGTWRQVQNIWVKVGSTWRQVSNAWINVGGTWRQWYSSVQYVNVQLLNYDNLGNVDDSIRATFLENGVLTITMPQTGEVVQSGMWTAASPATVTPQTAALYEILFTEVSFSKTGTGTATRSGDAFGSWLNLGSGRFKQLVVAYGAGGGATNAVWKFTVQIRRAADQVLVASSTFTLRGGAAP